MAYRVNRIDRHSTNLVAGPFAEFETARAELQGLLNNDPTGQYEIRTHEGTLVDLSAVVTPTPLPEADIPANADSLAVSVFHVDGETVTPVGEMTTTPDPPESVAPPVVIPPEETAPAPLPPL